MAKLTTANSFGPTSLPITPNLLQQYQFDTIMREDNNDNPIEHVDGSKRSRFHDPSTCNSSSISTTNVSIKLDSNVVLGNSIMIPTSDVSTSLFNQAS
ncbi:hypothetical protein V6N13_008106 [Hibiscus sabdariffa]